MSTYLKDILNFNQPKDYSMESISSERAKYVRERAYKQGIARGFVYGLSIGVLLAISAVFLYNIIGILGV